MQRNTQASVSTRTTLGGVVMIIEQELREQMLRVLSGQMSLNDLYAWLMDRSWNMHKDSEPPAVELAAEVEALFFERSDGLILDSALLKKLRSLLNNISESWEVADDLKVVRPLSRPMQLRPSFGRFSSSFKVIDAPVPSRKVLKAKPMSAQMSDWALNPVPTQA
jgi:hypothetical protein